LTAFFVVFAACSLFRAVGGAPAAEPRPLPNFVHFMTDDHGWTDVGYLGYRKVKTPNLDAMAAGGLVLTRFYSPSACCTPSRVSITMGRHCTRYGVMTVGGCDVPPFDKPKALPKPKGNITMAQGLKAKGYATAHFGKAHGSSAAGMDFVHYYGNADAETDVKGTEEALKFIRKAVADKKPFYVRLWTSVPHKAYTPLPKHLEPYGDDPNGPYWAEVSLADELLGKVRAELRALGVAENTLLWFSSDNGGHAVHQQGVLRGGKGNLYEGGVRVPGIIEYPALIKTPRRTDVPASGLDILPTVFELAGVPLPTYELDGVSLVPLLRGEMKERPKPIPFWFRDNSRSPSLHFALTDNRYKLLTTLTDAKDDELYDIPADMAETNNLAATHPEIVARMRAELARWKASVETSMAGKDP
jgi:arylsulfatase A-like enzyme